MCFCRGSARPAKYPLIEGIEGFPFITEIVKREQDKANFGGIWHADTTYLETSPMGSILYALQVPPWGGDTLFPTSIWLTRRCPSLRNFLDGLTGVSTSVKADVSKTREDMISNAGQTQNHNYVAAHPVVRTHPETGRKCLYVNVAHTSHFKGMTEKESAPKF